jgi:hypothetical protein
MSLNSPAELSLRSRHRSARQAGFMQWFDKFYSAVVAVGTLGAGFTFSVIFSLEKPTTFVDTTSVDTTSVDTNAVRHFLIISWLLFVLAVAIASVSAALVYFMDVFNKSFGKMAELLCSLSSLVLQLLIVAAFLMSARAVKMYDEDSGMASVVIISIIGCLLIVFWIASGCCWAFSHKA